MSAALRLTRSDLDRAFSEREFFTVLQPQIDARTGAIRAAEIFVRWRHAEFGVLAPQLFLGFLEHEGASPRLLALVLRDALEAASAFADEGADWRVSINLGVSDLTSGAAAELTAEALQQASAQGRALIIEAPEAALPAHGATVHTLATLKAMGCRLALDSGPSLPLEATEIPDDLFDEVKMGGAAIIRFAEIARKLDSGRISARLRFAQSLGLESVAVGVEDERTLKTLTRMGFTAFQGALVKKPMVLETLLGWDGGWDGEPQRAAHMPQRMPRPVAPAPAPPPARERLVETLRPAALPVDTDDDAFDLDLDDDTHAGPDVFAFAGDADPTADTEIDAEETHALGTAPPLHAGLIGRTAPAARPALRMVPEGVEADAPLPEAPKLVRPLGLAIQPAPAPGLLERIGLDKVLRW